MSKLGDLEEQVHLDVLMYEEFAYIYARYETVLVLIVHILPILSASGLMTTFAESEWSDGLAVRVVSASLALAAAVVTYIHHHLKLSTRVNKYFQASTKLHELWNNIIMFSSSRYGSARRAQFRFDSHNEYRKILSSIRPVSDCVRDAVKTKIHSRMAEENERIMNRIQRERLIGSTAEADSRYIDELEFLEADDLREIGRARTSRFPETSLNLDSLNKDQLIHYIVCGQRVLK
jgi:hypothetical protein